MQDNPDGVRNVVFLNFYFDHFTPIPSSNFLFLSYLILSDQPHHPHYYQVRLLTLTENKNTLY